MTVEMRKKNTGFRSFYAGSLVSALLLSGAGSVAMAGQVTQFGQWTVNNGTIDTDLSCQDINIVCTVLVEGSGFRQELVDAGTSGAYIRTIVTEENASGGSGSLPFEQEVFTPFNSAARATFGFDMNSAVRDTALGFQSIATIDRDPFVDVNTNQLTLTTIDLNTTLNTPEIVSNFTYASNELTGFPDPANNIFGKTLDIDVDVFIDCNGTTTQMSGGGMMMGCPGDGMGNFIAQQRFVQRDREGWNIDISTGSLVTTPITTAGSMQLDPSVITVAWNDGDSISTHWIAQTDNQGGGMGGGMGGGGGGGGMGGFTFDMNFQSVSNNGSGATAEFSNNNQSGTANFTVTTPIDPFAWDPVFGPPPASLDTPQ